MTTDKENVFCGHASEVSVELKKSAFGSHFLVIYPDLLTLGKCILTISNLLSPMRETKLL